MMELNAERAREMAQERLVNGPTELLQPIYEKIYEAASFGKFSTTFTFPEDARMTDKLLAIKKLTCAGYRMSLCRESGERIISW